MRRLLLFSLLLSSSVAMAQPPAPKLVVTLVIDQLAAWQAAERVPLLPSTGGFARLRREGTWLEALVYQHAVTDTAPGHAALYTGAPPHQSAILSNERIEDVSRDRVSLLRDDATRLIGSDGPLDEVGSSLAKLALPTLADELRDQRPTATIVSLSLKDRAALPGGGRSPDATLWYESSLGRFVTSTAVAKTFPIWAKKLDRVDRFRSRRWELMNRDFVATHAATPDKQRGEGELNGFGTTFPHDLSHAENAAKAFRATPFADEALLDLALAAVDARRAGAPMLLAVSLSSNDYIGHLFGPDSWESWDELERLDALLTTFFHALDEKVGKDNWAVLVTGDHGVETMPEAASPATRPWCQKKTPDRWQRPCTDEHRILPDALAAELRRAAREALGNDDDWVSGVADPYVFLTPKGRALAGAARQKLDDALIRVAQAQPGIDRVVLERDAKATCPATTDTSIDALVCRAMRPNMPVEMYLLVKQGSFFDPDYAVGFGVSHGSPYLYDRAVPLFVRAPGHVAAGRVDERPAPAATFTRTAATLLGVPAPPGVRDGRDLAR